MKAILSAKSMAACDAATINVHKVPSLVLMERAAKAIVNHIINSYPEDYRICVICGPGNNGGDGVAISRMLNLAKRHSTIILLGDEDKYSSQLKQQIEIAESYNFPIYHGVDKSIFDESDLFVDAMFGIGLARGLESEFLEAAELVNNSKKPVIAVDIPSGYDANCGKLLGEAGVKVDTTITFAYLKKGLLLGDCKGAAGKVQVVDVGIYLDEPDKEKCFFVDKDILKKMPKREVTANKGTCGKLLVIAGSSSIYGACYLSAKAAITAGAGLVKIFTHKNNVASIQQALPEAMYYGYEAFEEKQLLEEMKWVDAILIGPGLGTSETAENIVNTVLKNSTVPVIIDADGLNICSKNLELLKECAKSNKIIVTPHLKEMERLTGVPVDEINYSMEKVARDFATSCGVITVLKNFTTLITDGNIVHYNGSGNQSLATPGSGDVLAGIISGLLVQGIKPYKAAVAGAYYHGTCGEYVSKRVGIKGVLASDIIEEMAKINVLT